MIYKRLVTLSVVPMVESFQTSFLPTYIPLQQSKVISSTSATSKTLCHQVSSHHIQHGGHEEGGEHRKKTEQRGQRKDWNVWKTADYLERNGLTQKNSTVILPQYNDIYPRLTQKVVNILREWGNQWAGDHEWQGILNKSTLLHEIEESIVTLGFFMQFLDQLGENENVVIVDVCSGKGIFSMLASYICQGDSRVKQIIMLDKGQIKWNHCHEINASALQDGRPVIDTWRCNLHDTDDIVRRLNSIQLPVAVVGIHLCKTLSPSCIGVVNQLTSCPFFVLAPCCLPRSVLQRTYGKKSVIRVLQYETDQEREIRFLAKKRRDAAMSRKPLARPLSMVDQLSSLDGSDAGIDAACWKCGEIGHMKVDCTSRQSTGKPSLLKAPVTEIDVTHVLDSEEPFNTYCSLLSKTIQMKNVSIIDTGLFNENKKHQEGNWNSDRKSIFMVCTE